MNCPVRTEPFPGEGHNQNPPELAPELTTRRSLNSRRSGTASGGGGGRIDLEDGSHGVMEDGAGGRDQKGGREAEKTAATAGVVAEREVSGPKAAKRWISWARSGGSSSSGGGGQSNGRGGGNVVMRLVWKVRGKLTKYVKFIGPGFMVAVAYIDPGTYIAMFDCEIERSKIDGLLIFDSQEITLLMLLLERRSATDFSSSFFFLISLQSFFSRSVSS
jgi:metal iron transporter